MLPLRNVFEEGVPGQQEGNEYRYGHDRAADQQRFDSTGNTCRPCIDDFVRLHGSDSLFSRFRKSSPPQNLAECDHGQGPPVDLPLVGACIMCAAMIFANSLSSEAKISVRAGAILERMLNWA